MTHDSYAELIQKTLDSLSDQPLEETLKDVIASHFGENSSHASLYFEKIKNEINGYGPLGSLLDDPTVSEILINGRDVIYFEKDGKLQPHDEIFSSERTWNRFIHRLLGLIDKSADARIPLADGTLPDGSRVHVALPPVVPSPIITIRKHLSHLWKLADLVGQAMMTPGLAAQLETWVTERKNILICGSTGSGKTTLLRALLQLCPAHERLITLEDTPEISSVGPHHINLFTREDPSGLAPAIGLTTLLKNSLRMRPDRIIIGEVRGEEALVMLDALATGHRGSMSTLHAATPQRALRRLESLVSRAAPRWELMTIRQLIYDGIDIVVTLEKKNGLRRISQTAQISGIESFGYLLDYAAF